MCPLYSLWLEILAICNTQRSKKKKSLTHSLSEETSCSNHLKARDTHRLGYLVLGFVIFGSNSGCYPDLAIFGNLLSITYFTRIKILSKVFLHPQCHVILKQLQALELVLLVPLKRSQNKHSKAKGTFYGHKNLSAEVELKDLN